MDPTNKEAELQRTAKLLVYVLEKRGAPVDSLIKQTAANQYANEDYVPELCNELRILRCDHPDQYENIVYNAHDKVSRDLADWWDDHQAADARRNAEKQRDVAKEVALAKLTAADRKLLGLA